MKAQHRFEAFATTVNDLDDRLPKSRGRCFDIGQWGGCGLRCAAFIDGECEEPQEFSIKDLEDEFTKEEVEELKDMYPCFSLQSTKGEEND